MNRILRWTAAVGLSGLTANYLALAQTSTPPAAPAVPRDWAGLATILDEAAAAGRFSGTVLAVRGGKTLLEKTSGLRDVSSSAPIDADTRFNIASIGKLFTTVAVAQLHDEKRLGFDDRVTVHLPEFRGRPGWDAIRVRHLLQHTSGLGDFRGGAFAARTQPISRISELIPYFADQNPSFEPGSRFSYSNTGFVVLGLLVERVSGKDFYRYVEERIFAPAGMRATTYSAVAERTAVAYADREKGADGKPVRVAAPADNQYRGNPAGGVYSTARDMAKFFTALEAGKLVRSTTFETLTTGGIAPEGMRLPPGVQVRHTLGFSERTVNGARGLGHNGGAPGIGTEIYLYPDRDLITVLLTNYDAPYAMRLGLALAAVASSEPLAPLAPTTAPSEKSVPPGHSSRR